MTDPQLADLFTRAVATPADADDANTTRILDAALQEAAAVGLQRLTTEDVIRRSGLGRMTVYRRYPKRDDLVQALLLRETRRFLAAVAAGIPAASEPQELVAAAFVSAVTFARDHPLLRRVGDTAPGEFTDLVAADRAQILRMGTTFIAAQIHGDAPGKAGTEELWVAEVCARLFLTYVAIPSSNPDPADEAALRRFADEVLTPMIERVAPPDSR